MSRNVRIPADVDREDTIVAGLTARQVAVLAIAGLVLYVGWHATRTLLPTTAYLLASAPIAVAVAALVILRRDGLSLDRRDGLSLDRLVVAAIAQRLGPRRRTAVNTPNSIPPPWLDEAVQLRERGAIGTYELPATEVTDAGVVDLGNDGLAMVADCSTVNFALRTPDEQDVLTSVFGRYVHSLSAPAQILVRAVRLDLSDHVDDLRRRAAELPHPALKQAAQSHADDLEELASQADLLRRQVLLVLREPVAGTPSSRRRRAGVAPDSAENPARRAAGTRLIRRMREAGELLAPAGITVTALGADQATAIVASATHPADPPRSPETACADEVITRGSERGANLRKGM